MKKYNPKSFYYDNSFILGFIGVIFFILLGGRGCGKTFSTQKYCIKRWLKKHEPFCWLRLKEPSVRKLLANNGHDFIDAKLKYFMKIQDDAQDDKKTSFKIPFGTVNSVYRRFLKYKNSK